ncbi:MAG: PAS domain-containing protein [Lachnospiraceae bacterium]|nr:PAS domain-containing protein [Lachnospiraceae bacterium]
MSEGILTISMEGDIISANDAALSILSLSSDVRGMSFSSLFFDEEGKNDNFVQAFLDAVYENTVTKNSTVPYERDGIKKLLFISTFFLRDGEEKIGVAAVFSDITELNELRDSLAVMEKIKELNDELSTKNEFIKKTFGRYLSDEIVESILNTKDGLSIGGKRREISIMFTDIRGFTALSEKMPPEDLITMLNLFLSEMTDVIQENHGTIIEFIGDAIFAIFGAPVESDTKEYDAVKCSIMIQQKIHNLNADILKRGFPEVAMGIGIHTGDAIVGNIGSVKKTEYDVIGKNVNLASRIESYTIGGQILISKETREKLEGDLQIGKILDIMPKGTALETTIYEVLSLDGLSVPKKVQHFKQLEDTLSIDLQLLDGKHGGKEPFPSELLSFSEDELWIKTSAPLSPLKNILFSLHGEDIYAKVLDEKDGQFLLHITAGTLPLSSQ